MRAASNLFALFSPDPAVRARTAQRIEAAEEYGTARPMGEGWIAAEAPLPGGPVFPENPIPDGFLIAEGQEVLTAFATASRDGDGWGRLLRLALDTPEKLNIVPRDFTFLAFGAHGRVSAVRSCGGVVPLHVYRGNGVAAVATRVRDLVRFAPGLVTPDPLVWAAFASGCTVLPDHRSFVAGSRAVPRGHVAVIEPDTPGAVGRTQFVRYFDPRPDRWPEPTLERRAEHITRLRTLLLTTLETELDPNGGNVLSLSGGMDSSCLGALAAGELGYPVSTISLLPPKGSPGEEIERGYIESLNGVVGFVRQLKIHLDFPTLLGISSASPADVAFPMPNTLFAALGQVRKTGETSVYFGGEHANLVCGAEATLPDWAMATSLGGMLRSLANPPFSRIKDPLRWAAWRMFWPLHRPRTYMRMDLSDTFTPEIREEYREFIRRHRATGAAPGPWRFMSLFDTQDGWVGMGWEVASTLGMRRSLPFHTREALELVYDCHPSELVGPGRKKLLRAALDGLVPPPHLHRPDNSVNLVPAMAESLPWGRMLPECVHPLVSEKWRGAPATAPYPDAFWLTLLDRAGRSFEELAAR